LVNSARRPADPSRRSADAPRRAAYDVLRAVAKRDAYANLLLPALLAERGLAGRDAALATELTYGTLRGQGGYDAILAVCSDRPLDRIDPPLREVLRLGAHQLLATRIPQHAAVAASVDLAREVTGARRAGFVNAVLRRMAGRDLPAWMEIVAPDRAADPLGHLAVTHSHPHWVIEAFGAALAEPGDGGPGPQPGAAGSTAELEALLAADNERPTVTLLAKPGQAAPAELAGAGAQPARWSPYGAYLPEGDPAAIPAVAQGRAAVQDEASQLAAVALARAPLAGPDRRWLDVCAGPGGKAALLAGLADERGARLLAADIQPHRAALVRSAITRRAAAAVAADATVPAWRPGAFDRVLADAPCSGLGALRRRPEARWRRSAADVRVLGGLQRRLLVAALASLRPGGVAAYVTCSPHRAETRSVVEDVLDGWTAGTAVPVPGRISVLDAPAVLAEVPRLRSPEPDGRYAQFWPHRHGTDAIFLALLRRDA
jgi:16S rRNA (cytosine967-C5)-methyltransferase